MKTTVYFIILICIFSCKSNKNSINEKYYQQALLAFTELKETLAKDSGKLWNFKLDGPVMLVDRETRTIYANEADEAGKLSKYKELYTGQLPENENIANSSFAWNNKTWTIVALPLPDSKKSRMNLLMHESFHRIQPNLGFDSLKFASSPHLDSKEGRIYLKMELEALKMALTSEDPGTHLSHALIFRQYRHQLFPEAKTVENHLEIGEGLAEYTGIITCGMDENQIKQHLVSQINWFFEMPTYIRSFAYFTLPVYGFFMQQTNKEWNLKVSENTNLSDFIFAFFKMNNKTWKEQEILSLGKTYNLENICLFENQREAKKIVLLNEYKCRFLSDSSFIIPLEKMNFSFSPGNLVPMDSFGTVYPNLRITDNWGILEVDSLGALIASNYKSVTVSYPINSTESEISGKGWKLKLDKNWKWIKQDNNFTLVKK